MKKQRNTVLGSKLSQGNVGAAVCWKDKDCNSWKSISAFLGKNKVGKNKETVDGELWAIANGLEVARKTTLNSHNTPITIFSDSQEALAKLRQLSSHTSAPYLRSLIYQETSDLESKGHFVTIRWIPSHVGLGHDKADRSARDKARRGGGETAEQWSSLSHIKRRLIESHSQELIRWHEVKIQERDTSRWGFYIPRVQRGMSKSIRKYSKEVYITLSPA